MTGILCVLAGISSGGLALTVGSASFAIKGATRYYYGYSNSQSTAFATPSAWGTLSPDAFSGATIKAIYSTSPVNTVGSAETYTVVFSGNRAAGFFNTLQIDGIVISGTLGSPSYNSTNDETSFAITLASPATTLFGADGTISRVVLT